MNANSDGVGILEVRHDELVGRVDRIEASMADNLKRIYEKLEDIGNRPSWLTVSIISFLSSGFFSMLAVEIARSVK